MGNLHQFEQSAWTVSHFVEQVDKQMKSYGSFLLCGEISQCKQSSHLYFTIKDTKASLDCLMFMGRVRKLPFKPQVGQKVLLSGSCGLYTKTGKFSFVVEEMELTGIGQLMAQLEKLEHDLRAEGVIPRRPLPRPASFSKVVVVTSQSGTVRYDISNNVQLRNPSVKLFFIDTKVQGQDAPFVIAESLRQAYDFALANHYDAVILARGGGSFEDLLCFSDEQVVRAVAASPVFIISAIGHDKDHPLCDLAADVRVSTPTAAAEFITPVTIADLENKLNQLIDKANNLVFLRLDELQDRCNILSERMLSKRSFDSHMNQLKLQQNRVDQCVQRLDALSQERIKVLSERLQGYYNALEAIPERLQPYQERLNRALLKLDFSLERTDRLPRNFDEMSKHAGSRIDACFAQLDAFYEDHISVPLEKSKQRFMHLATKLETHNPVKQLQQGLTITTSDGEHIVDDEKLEVGQELVTYTKHTKIHSKIVKLDEFDPKKELEQGMSEAERTKFEEILANHGEF